MKYSVIVPAYQCENTIQRTISSILNAKLQDYEIIIVDDGSTDQTGNVCQKLCALHTNIIYIYQPNSGVSAARNRGIQHAEGEYILFVDADDELISFDYQKIEAILTDETDMLIFGMEFQTYKSGKCVCKEQFACDTIKQLHFQELGSSFSELFSNNYFSSSCNKFIRRSILVDNAIQFNTGLINYEDLEFSIRVMSYCQKIIACPSIHYKYYLTYNHDRTIERVKRIPNIISNVDLIAEAMFLLNHRVYAITKSDCEPILIATLQLYFDMLICKMKTTPLVQVREQCESFRLSPYVDRCMLYIGKLPPLSQRIFTWITSEQYCRIWIYFRYRNLRNRIVSAVKTLLRRY